MVEMVAMIQTHILTALIAAALAAVCAWVAQDWRYDARIADMQQAHAQAMADAAQKAMDDTIKMQRTKDDAIAKAEQRAAQNAAAARDARSAADGPRL